VIRNFEVAIRLLYKMAGSVSELKGLKEKQKFKKNFPEGIEIFNVWHQLNR
jgi:hypothetical protein